MLSYGNVKSVCASTTYSTDSGGYPAYAIDGTSQVLVFFRYNGRPGLDRIRAVLVDSKTGQLVDQAEIGTYMLQSFGVLKTAKGVKLQTVQEQNIPGMNCDCDAALQQGWMKVSVRGGKISKRWM